MRRLIAALLTMVGLCSLALAPSALAAVPTISKTTISDVTSTSVILEADVNPQNKAATFHFEYGPADCASNPCTSTPEGVIAKGSATVRVKAEVKGLTPGATYHFRALAKNADGEATPSPDRTFATYLPSQEFGPCPNDFLRKENPAAARIEHSSANLPDCRAYEQASPVGKGAGDAAGMVSFERTSSNGGAIVYISVSGIPGGKGSQEIPIYLAQRGEGGWSSRGLLPPASYGQQAKVIGWTPDFTDVFSQATLLGEPPATTMLDDRGGAGPEQIVDYVPALRPQYAGSSAGAAQVLFESRAAIPTVAGATGGLPNLYVWDRESKQVRLAGVMNDGQAPPKGAVAGPYDWGRGTTPQTLAQGGAALQYYTQEEQVISADGKAAYFTAAGSGRLYARLNPTEEQSALDGEGKCTQPELACTVQVNASEKKNGQGPGGGDPAGSRPAAFMGASADGSKALFTSTEMLTDDANTGPEQEAAAIVRANLDGTAIERAFVPTHAASVAVDSEHIYWVNLDTGTIARAKLDGTAVEEEFITATDHTRGLAVGNGHIYWTNGACVPEECAEGEGTIGRAKLNGEGAASEVEQSFIPNAGNAWAVAVNGEHVYWTRSALINSGRPFIARAKLDGTEVEEELVEVFQDGARLPGIALDSGHVYWMIVTPLAHSGISRADLDGGDYLITYFDVEASAIDTTRQGRGIAIEGNHVYWAAQGTGEIGRAQINGDGAASEVELEFIKGASHPYGVAADGSHLYWSANGEAQPNPGNDLYQYDASAPPGGALVDLAPDSSDANGAEVRVVLGTSQDASYVYFAANGVPDGVTGSPNGRGEEAKPGDCPAALQGAGSGECNLYLAHAGTVEFIARLEVGGLLSDVADWVPSTQLFASSTFQKTARVSPDGQTLLFRSQRRLSDYPNEGAAELYRFEVGEGSVRCVTCDPSGEPPGGQASSFFGQVRPSTLIPASPSATLTHNLSADGKRVFFETTEALVGEDTNGEGGCPLTGSGQQGFPACTDVYEWEAQGSGSCDAAHAVADGGCLYLISTGKGSEPQLIADASADGKEVFFFTRSRLVGQDEDQLVDIYTARVDGGLAGQNPPPPDPCLSLERCHPAGSQPPPIQSPPKFSGPGNPKVKPCPKGKHRVKGRCVPKKHKKAKKKKHHKSAKGKAHAKGRARR